MKHALGLIALLTPLGWGPTPAPTPVVDSRLVDVRLQLLCSWTAPRRPLLSEDLDRVIQSRFGSVTRRDVEEGRLGASRIMAPTHRRMVLERGQEEREALAGLEEKGWRTTVWVQPAVATPALIGPIQTAQEAAGGGPGRPELFEAARWAMSLRGPVQAFLGGARVEARPIPASTPECLSCHTRGVKLGDPLGAVVYVLQSGTK